MTTKTKRNRPADSDNAAQLVQSHKKPKTAKREADAKLASSLLKSKKKKKKRTEEPTKAAKVRRSVTASQLQWKTVSVPDMLEDYGGFYGLEEIEGVELVKKDGGQIEMVVTDENLIRDDGNVTDEWEGFSDIELEEEPELPKSDEREKDVEASKRAKNGEKTVVVATIGDTEDIQDINNGDRSCEKAETKEMEDDSSINDESDEPATKKAETTKPIKTEPVFIGFSSLAPEESLTANEAVDVSEWSNVPLSAPTLNALSKLTFSKPTPIQKKAIPVIMDGENVIGKAATGSGKTLAFGLPILESWLADQSTKEVEAGDMEAETTRKVHADQSVIPTHPLTALVIAPTRELAHQISRHLDALFQACPGGGPKIATLTGGMSVQKQRRILSTAGVVIGTPGRLWDVLHSDNGLMEWARNCKFLIVDEADRLLQDGHFGDLDKLLSGLDRKVITEREFLGAVESAPVEEDGEEDEVIDELPTRQTLVFSATFDKDLQASVRRSRTMKKQSETAGGLSSMAYLFKKLKFSSQPKLIDVDSVSHMVSGLLEGIISCGAMEKDLYLYATLLIEPVARTIVFANSVHAAKRVCGLLKRLGLPAEGLNSNMTQKARLRHLERFSGAEKKKGPPAGASSEDPEEEGGEMSEVAIPGQTSVIRSILVTTDVAARGLDVPAVDRVIHYHVPRTADTYVHRCGRTARAGRTGSSIVLCSPQEAADLRHMTKLTHGKPSANEKTAGAGRKGAGRRQLQQLVADPAVVGRLRDRVGLAQNVVTADMTQARSGKMSSWEKEAREALGVESESDGDGNGASARGKEWRRKGDSKREAQGKVGKAQVKAWAAQLRQTLAQKVNVGVSEKYASSAVRRAALKSVFVGEVVGLGW